MGTVASRPSPANVVIRLVAAIAIALSTVMPATFAFAPPPAHADATVRGPVAHLQGELDQGRVARSASPFALFAQGTSEPVDTGHVMGVKYTFVDSAYAEGYTSLDDLAASGEIGDAMLGQYESHVGLYDFGSDEWLAAFVDTTRENGGAGAPLEVVFGKWDTTGTVYDFVDYDAESGIAYVPKSFYYDEDGTELARSIQCQVVLPYSFSADSTASVAANVTSSVAGVKAASPSQVVQSDAIEPDITIPVVDPQDAGKVTLSDIVVRAEDREDPLELVAGQNARYDSTTGELTITNAPVASTTYSINVASASAGSRSLSAQSAEADSMNAWPWGKIENWGTEAVWAEGASIQVPSYVSYGVGENTSYGPLNYAGNWQQYCSEVMSHGCLYTSPNNSTVDFSAGSTNWLIERLVDGAPFDEIKGSLEAGIWGAEDITFAFTFPGRDTRQEVDAGDGNVARNVGVHGLTDPTGAMDNPTLIAYCGHLALGNSLNNSGELSRVFMHVLKVDEEDGYVVCGFVTPHRTTQTGVAVYKFLIDRDDGAIDLYKHSADDSVTDGNASYRLNATYGLYRDAACTDKVGELALDESGHSYMGGIAAGDYYVKEISAPAGYELDGEAHLVTVRAAETTRVDLDDVPQTGSADIVKVSDAPDKTDGNPIYSLAGIRYAAYLDEACTQGAGWDLTLDGGGHARREGLALGTYWLKEDPTSLAGKPYDADASAHRVTIEAGRTAYLEVSDHAHLGSADIVKVSDAPDKTDGNPAYSLAGIVYNAYADEACMDYLGWGLVLDEAGHAQRGNLAAGTYWLKEDPSSLAGRPFEADATAHRVDVRPGATSYLKVSDHALLATAEIAKTSTTPNISEENACYSYAGIRYDVYLDEACTRRANVDTLVLDEDGKASVSKVPLGTYWLKEDPASVEGTGFKANDKAYKLEVASVDVVATPSEPIVDEPLNDPLYVSVSKLDELTGKPSGSGPASLAGAEFEVRYWDNRDGSTAGDPTRTWTFQTDDAGRIRMDEASYLVAGDELYRNDLGSITYPLGTYSIVETKAPASYLLPVKNEPYVFQITDDWINGEYNVGNTLDEGGKAVYEAPIRHDFTFVKVDEESQERMAYVPFVVSRLDEAGDAVESHVIVTDANGRFDSSSIAHSHKTNANDAALSTRADGTYAVDESRLDPNCGLWFGVGEDGGWTAPDDSYGAIPDSATGLFRVEEVRSSANAGRDLVTFHVTARADAYTEIDLGTVLDSTPPSPEIGTSAMDAADEDRVVSRDVDAKIRDLVSMSTLAPGMTYTLVGTVIDKATGEAICDADGNPYSGKTTFTATTTNTARNVDIAFDATLVADGGEVVVFEKLYDADGTEVASHADIEDVGQTLRVKAPSVHTTATDAADGDHAVASDVTAKVVDVVTYDGLAKGATYEITGALFDKAAGRPFVDADGSFVTATTQFVSQGGGSVTMAFEFDSTALCEDTELVVFETVTRDGRVIAEHSDPDDAAQTVVIEVPAIGTTATDAADGDHAVASDVAATIDDEIAYTGLVPGKTYVVSGRLVDKATGQPLLDASGAEVTTSATFVPERANGTVTVTFAFDSTNIAGNTEVVAFEEVTRDGRVIAVHADIEDAAQTVVIEVPAIHTTATDAADGDHVASRDVAVTIDDEIAYTGLVPGKTYVASGRLVDKATGQPLLDASGAEVTASATFTPDAPDGTVTVKFAFDATTLAGGTEVVAFEEVSRDGRVIAVHADIEDTAQTVVIEEPAIRTMAVERETGEHFANPDGALVIVDTVSYAGLVPGKAYELDGCLMDKETATQVEVEGLPVISSATFVAEASSGSAEVEFAFDASALGGTSLVAFETLYDVEGNVVAEHADIDDVDQTVEILPPGEPPIGIPFAKTGVMGSLLMLLVPFLVAGAGLILIALSRREDDPGDEAIG